MVGCADRLRGVVRRGAGVALAMLLMPAVVRAEPYAYVARAHIIGVQQSFLYQATPSVPGAGVRAFQDPDSETGGRERFDIRWYANPPGIPPGTVLLLEAVQERSPVVRSYFLRTTDKSEGNTLSVLEIPPDKVRQGGRVIKWRLRVVWRGKVLATQTSANWTS